MRCSTHRNIEFVRDRDGEQAAKSFAQQAVRSYRRAVIGWHGRLSRPLLIAAYVCAKRYASSPREEEETGK